MACDCCGGPRWQPLFRENGLRLGVCPDCDLHSLEQLPRVESRMTEMEAGHYAGDLEVLDAERQLASERVLADRFRAYVELAQRVVPGGHWLDIGCGAGLLLTLAAEAGYAVSGIELTADRRAAAARVTGATIHGAPLEDLGLPDAGLDVVSMINVFSHLVSPRATFAEIRRVLRPGGVLVLATGEMGPGVERTHMHNWNLGDHLHFLGDRTMGRYAAELGWEVASSRRVWLPEEMYTREWLQMRGRDPRKNAVKTAILRTPGAFPAFRAAMLRRQRDSAAHSATYVLRRPVEDRDG